MRCRSTRDLSNCVRSGTFTFYTRFLGRCCGICRIRHQAHSMCHFGSKAVSSQHASIIPVQLHGVHESNGRIDFRTPLLYVTHATRGWEANFFSLIHSISAEGDRDTPVVLNRTRHLSWHHKSSLLRPNLQVRNSTTSIYNQPKDPLCFSGYSRPWGMQS